MFGYQVLGFGAGGSKSPTVEATGGNTVTDNGDFKVHTFTSPGQITFQAIPARASVEYYMSLMAAEMVVQAEREDSSRVLQPILQQQLLQ